jgi:hypothetical protein
MVMIQSGITKPEATKKLHSFSIAETQLWSIP